MPRRMSNTRARNRPIARQMILADDRNGREIDDSYKRPDEVVIGEHTEKTTILVPDPFEESAEVFKTMPGLSDTVKKRAYRAFKKSHEGSDGAGSTKIEPGSEFVSINGYQILDVVRPPENLDALAKWYTASSANYAAVNTKTANIVGLGYDFIETPASQDELDASNSDAQRAKKTKRLRGVKNEMMDWLDNCHKEDDFLETLRAIYIDYEATGNGYMEIGRKRGSNEVGYIGHIPSTSMRVRRLRDGFVQITGSNKTVFFKHFGTDTKNPINDTAVNEVIHFKKYSPTNSFYGVPDIVAATQAVAGIEFAARFNLDYFENKAVPRYVVVVKGGDLSKKAQTDIVEFFETSLRGKNHRTLFIPLPADRADEKVSFEMKPVEAGTQDASFVNYNKINLNSIFMAHRTPMSKVTLVEGVSLAAARDADKTFKEGVCRPEQKIFEKKFNKVIATKTNLLRFKLNELTLTDEDTQSKIDERYLRMQVLVPNEVRARAGMPGLKGGDNVVDLKAQAAASGTTPGQVAADAAAQGNRARDSARSAAATDSAGNGRNAKGDGRAVAN